MGAPRGRRHPSVVTGNMSSIYSTHLPAERSQRLQVRAEVQAMERWSPRGGLAPLGPPHLVSSGMIIIITSRYH